jgi:excisionase family DNA binding protein
MQIGSMKIYTTEEAAKEMDIHIDTLRRMIRNGELKATKRQNRWFIPEQYIHEYYLGGDDNEEKTD